MPFVIGVGGGGSLPSNVPLIHSTAGVPDYLTGQDGTQLFPTSIKCPFYDAPSAVANTGLTAFFTDVPGLWYSNGVRWLPVGGRIALKSAYYQDVSATRSLTPVSQCKAKLPYSLLNGSVFRDGDQIKIQSGFKRLSSVDSAVIRRNVYAGSNSTTPSSNVVVDSSDMDPGNVGVNEQEFCFRRIDSTTVQVLGSNIAFVMFNGDTGNDLMPYGGSSDIPSMDVNDTYIDLCLSFNSSSADSVVLYYALIELVTPGG